MQPNRREFMGTAALAAAPAPGSQTAPSRALLSGEWPEARIAGVLVPRETYHPFPRAAERSGWQTLGESASARLVEEGARGLGGPWPSMPATLFLEFARNGNRSRYERLRGQSRGRLQSLAVAECVEGKGRFLDEIANGVWAACEESFWGVPAHIDAQKAGKGLPDVTEPIVDLFAAETASLLAWIDYLLGEQLAKVNPLVPARIRVETERRLLKPNRERVDFWWMGLDPARRRNLNNWTPWIDSNWLTSLLLLEDDPARRTAGVHKILRSLDVFLDGYHDDGGCDEGPSYWGRAGASLYECLDMLRAATRGEMNFFKLPLVGEIGRYIYRAHIHDDYFVNFADAPAKVRIPGQLVYRYGRRIGDERMQGLGAWAAQTYESDGGSIGRQLPALFDAEEIGKAKGFQPLVRDVWMPGIQVMAARVKEGSPEGLYLAAQGGHNAESHNHNDVGNFIVYSGGKPVIVDVGVETYTAKTFSSQRYDIWTMQSAYHNLPTIGGAMQAAGRQYAAERVVYHADDGEARLEMEIGKAWPEEAGIQSWMRLLRLDRARNQVTVEDSYQLRKAVPRITLTLMSACQPEPAAGGVRLGDVKVSFYPQVFTAKPEEIRIQDARLRASWGGRLWRVLLVAENPAASARWVMRIA